jgi:hypothetical protein
MPRSQIANGGGLKLPNFQKPEKPGEVFREEVRKNEIEKGFSRKRSL